MRRFFYYNKCLKYRNKHFFKKYKSAYLFGTMISEKRKGRAKMKKSLKKFVALSLTFSMLAPALFNNVYATEQVQTVQEGSEISLEEGNKADSLTALVDANLEDWYEVGGLRATKVQEGVLHIDEATAVNPAGFNNQGMNNCSSMYLIIDGNEVVLIDGGNGAASANTTFNQDLKSILDELVFNVDKDLQVIIAHNHGDHTGAFVTTEVIPVGTPMYIHEKDYAGIPEVTANYEVQTFKQDDVLGTTHFKMKVVDVPGQTEGSCALINYEREIIFSDDSVGSSTVYLGNLKTLEEFEYGVNNLWNAIKDMDNPILYSGHRWQQYDTNPYVAATANTEDQCLLGEIGKQYVKEFVQLMKDVRNNEYITNKAYGNGISFYSEASDLNHDGKRPGFTAQEDAVLEFASQKTNTATDTASYDKAISSVIIPRYEADGSKTEQKVSEYLKAHLDTTDLTATVDESNKTLTVDVQLKDVYLASDYLNGKSAAGESYYNMMNYYTDVLQIQQLLDTYPQYTVVDNKGNEVNSAYIDELAGLLKQINDFDPTTNLKYDYTKSNGSDVIATSKEGNVTLTFHIDSHGWWGYDLGAHDSITGLVMGLSDEEAQEMQHEYTLKYGHFFVIQMDNQGPGQLYMLRGTDLENPMIYVSEDGKEAFMIDVDMYGSYALNNVIKSVIGDKCESLKIFLTHNHGDHVNNLAMIAQDERLKEITTLIWPENEPHTVLTEKDTVADNMIGQDLVELFDVQTISDMEKISVAGNEFQFVEIPDEHTPGGGQLADLTNNILYSGDTLGAQVHLGGTTVSLSSLQSWIDGVQKSVNYIEEHGITGIIGGHTPYLNTSDFASWVLTALEYAQDQVAQDKKWAGGLVIVENGKVVTSERMSEMFANGLTDAEELKVASVNFRNDLETEETQNSQNPQDSTTPKPNEQTTTSPTSTTSTQTTAQTPQTGDQSVIGLYVVTGMIALGAGAYFIKKRLN